MEAIVVVAAVVSVLALVASVVVALTSTTAAHAAAAQAKALQSSAGAEAAAERLLASLDAVGKGNSLGGVQKAIDARSTAGVVEPPSIPAFPVFAVFADTFYSVQEREIERLAARLKEAESNRRFAYAASWHVLAERADVSPRTPWWANAGGARPPEDVEGWSSTGSMPSLV